MRSRLVPVVALATLLLFLSFNWHSRTGYFNYHSEIWADKAGYYVYLPAAFIYDFRANQFPAEVDENTGKGFKLNQTNNTVETKYTYGVAFMQIPFFLSAHAFSSWLGQPATGFSPVYHSAINVAAVFYLLSGLFILGLYLKKRFTISIVVYTLATIFLGTNLFYYGIADTGMSHIYSFFLLSLFLYLLCGHNFWMGRSIFPNLLIGILIGLIVVIRPTNVLFILPALILEKPSQQHLYQSLKFLLRPGKLIPILVGIVMAITPQLLYWKHTFGNFVSYSYNKRRL